MGVLCLRIRRIKRIIRANCPQRRSQFQSFVKRYGGEKSKKNERYREGKETERCWKCIDEVGKVSVSNGEIYSSIRACTFYLIQIKDIKSIYTNRALAYIKLGRYKKAVADCKNVIEYMEIFEKGDENKDLCFKAHLRKAHANK